MKKLLLILLALVQSTFAGVSMLQVEKTLVAKEDPKDPEHALMQIAYKVTAWGILPEGRAKTFYFKDSSELLKSNYVENCEVFSLPRSTLRYTLFFDSEGNPVKIDFHMEDPFESVIKEEFDEQALTRISQLKTYIESL